MKIADLFVNIGITGNNNVAKGLDSVQKGLGGVVGSSLEAKAAVLAVVYGLERLTGFASQAGMDLYKFGAATGLSTMQLQKWQYAAMQFDVSADEMAGTIKGIQSMVTEMQMGGGMPRGMMLINDFVRIDPKRVNDTFYMLTKIQEFAKKAPTAVANNLLKSMGINENVFQFLKLSNVELSKMSNKKFISPEEQEKLKNVNIAWKEMWFNMDMVGKKFVAENGMFPVERIGKAALGLERFATAVESLWKRSDAFKAIATGIGLITVYALPLGKMNLAIMGIVEAMSLLEEHKDEKEGFWGFMNETHFEDKIGKWFKDMFTEDKKQSDPYASTYGIKPIWEQSGSNPSISPSMSSQEKTVNNITNTKVDINVKDGIEGKQVFKQEIQRAAAQSQGKQGGH